MLRLFDTARGQVVPLEPRDPGKVSIYACGPTVYGPPHVGHGRTNMSYDVLRRYLEWTGLDVRYVAAVRPALVASVTTVASPHKGADLADFLRANFVNGGFTQAVIEGLGEFLGTVIGLLAGSSNPQDIVAALDALTTAGTAAFNASFPQGVPASSCGEGAAVVNGIRYYSWSGTGLLTNALDIGDPALAVTSLFYDEANDGLVGRCSSHLGDVIRDNYFHNHLDEVNQVLGLVSIFESNPKTLFRSQANRLKNAGL